MSLILSSEECISVLTGIITPCTGMSNKHMKCANNNKPKPKQLQKKKRKHESSSAQNKNSATHLTTSTMVVKHVDWIKQIATKGSCNLVDDGKL